MNKKECASQYRSLMSENEKNINALQAKALRLPETFDAYFCFSEMERLAGMNDGYAAIAHVLEPSRDKPFSYGNADTIKRRRINAAGAITIAIVVKGDIDGKINKTFAQFFSRLGFKTLNNTSKAAYTLNARFTMEKADFGAQEDYIYYNYTLDAALKGKDGKEVFTWQGSDRDGGTTAQQARMAVQRYVEALITDEEGEDSFASAFYSFLNDSTHD
jgi:hypothetical protein